MTWSESVSEPPHKIYEVWREIDCMSSYWSTIDKALAEISRLSGIPKEELKFNLSDNWLIKEEGWVVRPGYMISEIDIDNGVYH